MAGCPGAGKTEFSKNLVENINILYLKEKREYKKLFIRIDIDEIRNEIPYYNGKNSYLIQKGANLILDKVRKYCIENNFSFVNDGTFGNQFSTFNKMIGKIVNSKKEVIIIFIFSHPLVA
jgi:adenylate kinase family enzyme